MARKKALKEFSMEWLCKLFDGTPDCYVSKKGSNVLDIVLSSKYEDQFAEGGIIRLIMDVLYDSKDAVKLISVGNSGGSRYYRLSTRVK